jgi:hypothetical protein
MGKALLSRLFGIAWYFQVFFIFRGRDPKTFDLNIFALNALFTRLLAIFLSLFLLSHKTDSNRISNPAPIPTRQNLLYINVWTRYTFSSPQIFFLLLTLNTFNLAGVWCSRFQCAGASQGKKWKGPPAAHLPGFSPDLLCGGLVPCLNRLLSILAMYVPE